MVVQAATAWKFVFTWLELAVDPGKKFGYGTVQAALAVPNDAPTIRNAAAGTKKDFLIGSP
jgi:hypothetical protein